MLQFLTFVSILSANLLLLAVYVKTLRIQKSVIHNQSVIHDSESINNVYYTFLRNLIDRAQEASLFKQETLALKKELQSLQFELDSTNKAYHRHLIETEELCIIGMTALRLNRTTNAEDAHKERIALMDACLKYDRKNDPHEVGR